MADKICPECGSILRVHESRCPNCGWNFEAARTVSRSKEDSWLITSWFYSDSLRSFLKMLVVLAILGGIGWGVYAGLMRLYRDVEETNPYPLAASETARQFFTNLQFGNEENFQNCYQLLTSQRKAATVIGKQSRGSGYFPHFERIRSYLAKYAGEDFSATMTIDEEGQRVTFPRGIVLHIAYTATTGLDKKTHYSFEGIKEFPIDVAPGIGIEAHNRVLDRAIDSMGSVGGDAADDVGEIVARRDYENNAERLGRLAESFKQARSLDTRHKILEWIFIEFPNEPATLALAKEIVMEKKWTPILRSLAQAHLKAVQR